MELVLSLIRYASTELSLPRRDLRVLIQRFVAAGVSFVYGVAVVFSGYNLSGLKAEIVSVMIVIFSLNIEDFIENLVDNRFRNDSTKSERSVND